MDNKTGVTSDGIEINIQPRNYRHLSVRLPIPMGFDEQSSKLLDFKHPNSEKTLIPSF